MSRDAEYSNSDRNDLNKFEAGCSVRTVTTAVLETN